MSGYFGFTQGTGQYAATGTAGQYAAAGYAVPATAPAAYGFTAATATAYSPYAQPQVPAPPQPQATPYSTAHFVQPQPPAPKPPAPQASQAQPAAPKANPSTYTGYDAAVYAAATSYLQSKATGTNSQWLGLKAKGGTTAASNPTAHAAANARQAMHKGNASNHPNSSSYSSGSYPRKTTSSSNYTSRGGGGQPWNRSPQQLHYCEVCKISCAGPQTYKEHLEGQKHKKKEQAAKSGVPATPLARTKASFRCDLCDVTCTGQDTYQAHVRGAKHLKTVKLHQTLGKPIPSSQPVVIAPANRPPGFVGGKNLTTLGGGGDSSASEAKGDDAADALEAALALEKDVQPVGEDYVEPMKDHTGKVVQFFCKLCDCKFNDMNAKNMHLKGRRHRLQFKKKVNPELEVDMKPIPGGRGNQRRHEEKLRKDLMRLRQQELWSMRAMYPDPSMTPAPLFARGPGYGAPNKPNSNTANPDSMDDRHVMAKHEAIYPTDDELKAVQTIVNNVEAALKGVSDAVAKADAELAPPAPAPEEGKEGTEGGKEPEKERRLKGVMRVGLLAKGLLLRGDLAVKLVVVCREKPTKTLLRRVMELLPPELDKAEQKYDVTLDLDNAAILVTATEEPRPSLTIVLTSVLMRQGENEDGTAEDPDILDRAKCQEALAELRHAKWFQARCTNLESCMVVLRLMRDICQRIPTWGPLSDWGLELLVEKVLTSAGGPLGAGAALRRVFEAVASGLLLPRAPGLLDPCEKDSVDALALSPQQREDMTSSAQHALRLIAFNQLHKILGIPRITPANRKRPLNPDSNNGKKDKKDEPTPST